MPSFEEIQQNFEPYMDLDTESVLARAPSPEQCDLPALAAYLNSQVALFRADTTALLSSDERSTLYRIEEIIDCMLGDVLSLKKKEDWTEDLSRSGYQGHWTGVMDDISRCKSQIEFLCARSQETTIIELPKENLFTKIFHGKQRLRNFFRRIVQPNRKSG